MRQSIRAVAVCTRAVLAGAAVGVSLILTAGCASIDNPHLKQDALTLSGARRDRVYPIFLNSQNDPLGVTGFKSMSNFARECGFKNTQYKHFSGGASLAEDIRGIRRADPNARLCLIGWSGASLYAFDATKMLAAEGVVIDELIYLDSNWVKDYRLNEQAHPTNVRRVALLYSENRTAPENVPHAVSFKIPTTSHTDVATHPKTADIVIRELMRLAGQ